MVVTMASAMRQQLNTLAHSGGSHKEQAEKYVFKIIFTFIRTLYYLLFIPKLLQVQVFFGCNISYVR